MWTALCSLDNFQFDHNKRQEKSCISVCKTSQGVKEENSKNANHDRPSQRQT